MIFKFIEVIIISNNIKVKKKDADLGLEKVPCFLPLGCTWGAEFGFILSHFTLIQYPKCPKLLNSLNPQAPVTPKARGSSPVAPAKIKKAYLLRQAFVYYGNGIFCVYLAERAEW